MRKVTVIGGLTVDLTYFVSEWPEVGEAPQAKSYILSPGGKGFNIATALRKLGAGVNLISAVGKDRLSEVIIQTLVEERFSTEGVFVKEDTPTDLITIIVDQKGRTGFIGTKLANQQLKTEDIERVKKTIETSDALITTLEVPSETVRFALEIARRKGILTIFNPSPPNPFRRSALREIDFFVPNKWEAEVLARKKVSSQVLCREFLSLGPKNVIITEHQRGGAWGSGGKIRHYSAFRVPAVDETGAGDAFCAALCVSFLEHGLVEEAVIFAAAAGALACTRRGARRAMPEKAEVESFLKESRRSPFGT